MVTRKEQVNRVIRGGKNLEGDRIDGIARALGNRRGGIKSSDLDATALCRGVSRSQLKNFLELL